MVSLVTISLVKSILLVEMILTNTLLIVCMLCGRERIKKEGSE